MIDFVSIGCLGIDNVIGTNGEKRLNLFGGNAAWGAMGSAVWGEGKVGIVSRAGTDFPRRWIAALASAGIDVTGIKDVPYPHAMLAGMVYDETGDRHEVTFNECSQSGERIEGFPVMTPQMVTLAHEEFAPTVEDIPDSYLGADLLVCARHYDRQLAYVRRFRKMNPHGLIVLDTGLAYMQAGTMDDLPTLFGSVDVVIPSEAEVDSLFGHIEAREAAQRLHGLGAKNVVIKLGKKGCLVDTGHGYVTVDAFHTNGAIDPSGAGDSFCGGFLVGYSATHDLVTAARYGTVSSSFAVERFGVDQTLGYTRADALTRLALTVVHEIA